MESEADKYIRFHWLTAPKEEFFEFRIEKSEITNQTILVVKDFAEKKNRPKETALGLVPEKAVGVVCVRPAALLESKLAKDLSTVWNKEIADDHCEKSPVPSCAGPPACGGNPADAAAATSGQSECGQGV